MMIGAHAAGIDYSYKRLHKLQAQCLVCGEYSECQITRYVKAYHIFYIKTKVLDEQFWFDWEKCNHRAVLFEKQDVARYKLEQVETGILSVPHYQNMNLQMMSMPKKVPAIQIALVIIASLLIGVLLAWLLHYFNIPFIP